MNERYWTAPLLYPAPLYAALLVLVHFSADGFGVPLGFLITLAFGSATALGLIRHRVLLGLGRLLFVLAVLIPAVGVPEPGGVGLDLAAGVILGAPFLWIEYAWRVGFPPATRVIALQSALLVGILCLATLGESSSAIDPTGGGFLQALLQVVAAQIEGIAAVLAGMTPNAMPLETTFDAVYVGLGGIALAGLVLSWVSPRTSLGERLPWSWVQSQASPAPVVPTSEELGLRPGQRDALATRTRPTPPEATFPPGFGALSAAGLLVLALVGLAVGEPTYTLLALVLGAAGAIGTVALVLSRRLVPLGGLAG